MSLNNLRDKLLQAGLVDEEAAKKAEADAKKAEAQARAKKANKKKGKRKPKGPPPQLTPEEIAAREEKKALEAERQANRKRAAEEQRQARAIRALVEEHGLAATEGDPFYFTARKGKIRRMPADAERRQGLESGQLAIVEHPLPGEIVHAVVPGEIGRQIRDISARALRFWNDPDSDEGMTEPDAPPPVEETEATPPETAEEPPPEA